MDVGEKIGPPPPRRGRTAGPQDRATFARDRDLMNAHPLRPETLSRLPRFVRTAGAAEGQVMRQGDEKAARFRNRGCPSSGHKLKCPAFYLRLGGQDSL